MLHPQAVGFPVQRLVAERDLTGGDSFEQFADAGVVEPGEDAFGALGGGFCRARLAVSRPSFPCLGVRRRATAP
jgi:hypothetical protein